MEKATKKIEQRLLIIAERQDIHNIVRLVLEDVHFTITSVYDIEDGLNKLKDASFDIILIDENQAISNGLSFCTELKKLKKIRHIPIILMYSDKIDENKIMQRGVNGIIKKPIEMDLIRKIKEVLNASKTVGSPCSPSMLNSDEITDFLLKYKDSPVSGQAGSQTRLKNLALQHDEINRILLDVPKVVRTNSEDLDIKPYDLSLIRRIARNKFPGLEYINSKFINQFRNTLIDWINKFIEISDCTTNNISCIDKITLNKELPTPSTFFTFTMYPLTGQGIFVIEDKLVYALTYMFLNNGEGATTDYLNELLKNRRDFNDIEQQNLNKFVKLMLSDYGKAWNQLKHRLCINGLNPKAIKCYRNPLFLFLDDKRSNEYFLVRKLSMNYTQSVVHHSAKHNAIEGNFYIAIPMLSVEPVINEFKSCSFEVINQWTKPVTDFLINTEVTLSVDINVNDVNISDILRLQKGEIFYLNRSNIDDLNVKVEGITKFKACCEKDGEANPQIVAKPQIVFRKVQITSIEKLDEELERQWYNDHNLWYSSLKNESDTNSIRLELGCGLFSQLTINNSNNSIDLTSHDLCLSRNLLFSERVGFELPKLNIIENLQIEHNMYEIYVNDIKEASGEVLPSHIFIFDDQLTSGTIDKLPIINAKDPVFGGCGRWINSEQFSDVLGNGINGIDLILRHIEEVIWCNIKEFFGYKQFTNIKQYLENYHKALIHDFEKIIFSSNHISSDIFLKMILTNLLVERVPIVEITKIIETIVDDNQLNHRLSLINNLDELIEKIRKALSRNIVKQYLREDGTISVIKLEMESEDIQNPQMMNPQIALNQIEAIYKNDRNRREPIILLCNHLDRIKIKGNLRDSKIVDNNVRQIIILADDEIPSSVRIKYKGMAKA
jgi:flagellar motor switch protein FliM